MPAVTPLLSPSSPPASSERRIAANRRNAQKSTGPRTAEGKARSRFNAVTHGLTTRMALIPDEDPAEYEQFALAMAEELNPQTRLEAELAERIVQLTWRRRRVWRAEEEVIDHDLELSHPDDLADAEGRRIATRLLLSDHLLRSDGARLLRLAEHDRRISASLDNAVRLLLSVQDRRLREEGDGPPEPDVPPEQPRVATPAPAGQNEPIAETPLPSMTPDCAAEPQAEAGASAGETGAGSPELKSEEERGRSRHDVPAGSRGSRRFAGGSRDAGEETSRPRAGDSSPSTAEDRRAQNEPIASGGTGAADAY